MGGMREWNNQNQMERNTRNKRTNDYMAPFWICEIQNGQPDGKCVLCLGVC